MTSNLKAALERVCELQTRYSPANTPEMQERGGLIRGSLRSAMEGLAALIAPELGVFGSDFHVDASDGIGRKTELPWVRFCSRRMSPRPTEGFYCVLHFSTDGSAMHVTIGCGSSRFFNGYSVVLPGAELDAQTDWARSVVVGALGSLAPFTDAATFGASRPLPKSFERATAMSKRVPVRQIEESEVEELLRAAAVRLRLIYEAQATGRDLSPADQEEVEIAEVIRPGRGGGRRQGFGLPPQAKRAVETRAMTMAEVWLSGQGYEVANCSATKPYDFEACRNEVLLKVEVKGTTSDRADAILMTRNEVELHRRERGATALIVVSKIALSCVDGIYVGDGGTLDAMIGWDIDEWLAEPTAYRLTRRIPVGQLLAT